MKSGYQDLCQKCPLLSHIELPSTITTAAILAISRNCPNLTHLNATDCKNLTDECLENLSYFCPLLQYISICGSEISEDEGIKALTDSCHDITELNLGNCYISDISLQYITKGCPQLHTLVLYINEDITDFGITFLSELKKLRFFKYYKSLTPFQETILQNKLKCCEIEMIYKRFDDDVVSDRWITRSYDDNDDDYDYDYDDDFYGNNDDDDDNDYYRPYSGRYYHHNTRFGY